LLSKKLLNSKQLIGIVLKPGFGNLISLLKVTVTVNIGVVVTIKIKFMEIQLDILFIIVITYIASALFTGLIMNN
jgi:hypothetical protein